MAIRRYLAMTASEIGKKVTLPPKIAWMACHFSPYSTGLSNCPRALPPGSLLILNDRIPICRHDPGRIEAQLWEAAGRFHCAGILLDFQRPDCDETMVLAGRLAASLPCPVAVSSLYGRDADGAVFLPPVPLHVPLGRYLASWAGREIWLELALEAEDIHLTAKGATFQSLSHPGQEPALHHDRKLHCRYDIQLFPEESVFSLQRTKEELADLLEEAETLGVTTAVGLYQELERF